MKYYAKFDADGNRITSIVEGVHFTTATELKKYTDDGFMEISEEDQELYATNDYIRDTKTGKPIPRPPYEPNVQEVANQTWQTIKTERDNTERAGCPYMCKTLDSDPTSVQRIAIAVQAAQQAISAKVEGFTLDWTMKDNSVIAMNANQIIGMSSALAVYSNQLHEKARQLRENIEKIIADYDQKSISENDAKTQLNTIKW